MKWRQSWRCFYRKWLTHFYVKYVLMPEAEKALQGEPGRVQVTVFREDPKPRDGHFYAPMSERVH